MFKRIFDITIALILFVAVFPVIPIVLLMLWLLGRRPIIKVSPLIGKNGKLFNFYIFNVLFKKIVTTENIESNGYSSRKFIEKVICLSKLYLWPTLINIIKGELSFIGPIPESQKVINSLNGEHKKLFSVRPGLLSPGFFCDARSIGEPLSSKQTDIDYYLSNNLPDKTKLELQYIGDPRLSKDFIVFIKLVFTKIRHIITRNVKTGLRTYNFLIPIDILLIITSVFVAYLLRFEWIIPSDQVVTFLLILPLAVASRIFVFHRFGMYKNILKYVGILDLVKIIQATSVSSILIIAVLFFFGIHGQSRSVFLMDWIICILLIGGSRLIIRLINESSSLDNKLKKNILIFGAGDVGEMLLRELNRSSRDRYNVVGFIDDDKEKHGLTLHGIPVLGGRGLIPQMVELFRIDEVFIALAIVPANDIKSIINYCKKANVRHKIVPAVSNSLNGDIYLSKLRNVEITDLFGREPVNLDISAIKNVLHNKDVLVTGAGGSIGSELCRQIAEYNPKSLILIDKNENYLHEIRIELTGLFKDINLICLLSDITNKEKQEIIFNTYKPQLIFHAAATKHVPLSEENPDEAIITNIIGTKIVANLAAEYDASHFILVSTDKAVNPTSIMGVSKRVAELYVQAICGFSKTKFMIVRFGNVLNSNGSVLPTFIKQIDKGGPITVTHEKIERYFMSINEAVQLILQAVSMGENGRIFLLDMGKSYKILELAKELIRLNGFKPYEDIDIEITGLRPGEKLFEELIGRNENVISTNHKSIKILESKSFYSFNELNEKIESLISFAKDLNYDKISETLKDIVPAYTPNTIFLKRLVKNDSIINKVLKVN